MAVAVDILDTRAAALAAERLSTGLHRLGSNIPLEGCPGHIVGISYYLILPFFQLRYNEKRCRIRRLNWFRFFPAVGAIPSDVPAERIPKFRREFLRLARLWRQTLLSLDYRANGRRC